jgi:hypothetical protein
VKARLTVAFSVVDSVARNAFAAHTALSMCVVALEQSVAPLLVLEEELVEVELLLEAELVLLVSLAVDPQPTTRTNRPARISFFMPSIAAALAEPSRRPP